MRLLRPSCSALSALALAVAPVFTQSAPTPAQDLSAATASQLLQLLPDGEEKRRFILDCAGCHTFDARIAAPGGRARTAAQWDSATHRMLSYAGATTGFPVISAAREPIPTALFGVVWDYSSSKLGPTWTHCRFWYVPSNATAQLFPPSVELSHS